MVNWLLMKLGLVVVPHPNRMLLPWPHYLTFNSSTNSSLLFGECYCLLVSHIALNLTGKELVLRCSPLFSWPLGILGKWFRRDLRLDLPDCKSADNGCSHCSCDRQPGLQLLKKNSDLTLQSRTFTLAHIWSLAKQKLKRGDFKCSSNWDFI